MKNATCLTVLGVTLALAPPILAQPAPKLSFANPTVNIGSAAQDGSGEIILRSDTAQTQPPVIEDSPALPNPPAATVTFEAIKDDATSANTWRYKVRVLGLSPANTVQQHYAKILGQFLPYFVTNQPAGSFAWTISRLPDPWVASTSGWSSDDRTCTGFTVTPKDSPATGLKLAASTLVEQSTKESIPVTDLRLCRGSGNCTQSTTGPIDLPANTPSDLSLCTVHALHGNFRGVVVLASLQKPDGDTILQNASFSSTIIKIIGLILILLGVAVAWLVKVFLRGRMDRDQSLQPVTLMRSQLLRMQQTLSNLRTPYASTPVNLNTAVTTLLTELSTPVLDQANLLPSAFPNPFGSNFDPAALKAYLEARNKTIQLLAVLVDEGVCRAQAEDNGAIVPAPVAQVNAAITLIDNIWLAIPQPAADQALQQVRQIVAGLHTTIVGVALAPAIAGPVPAVRGDFEVLRLEIQTISIAVWLIYALLTALSGFAVLVLGNAGFGVPLDLVFAFFWGFGLPTTIQSLTPGSSAAALNISVART